MAQGSTNTSPQAAPKPDATAGSASKTATEATTFASVGRDDGNIKAGVGQYAGKRVLFFINGNGNRAADRELVQKAREKYKDAQRILFRNALMVRADEYVEDAEVIAGHIPEVYLVSPKYADRLEPEGDYAMVPAHRVHPIGEKPILVGMTRAIAAGGDEQYIGDTRRGGDGDPEFDKGTPILHGSASQRIPSVTNQDHIKAAHSQITEEQRNALPVEVPAATLSTSGARDRFPAGRGVGDEPLPLEPPKGGSSESSDGTKGKGGNGGENLKPPGKPADNK
jgi:hypothetical protein